MTVPTGRGVGFAARLSALALSGLVLSACVAGGRDSICPGLPDCQFADPCAALGRPAQEKDAMPFQRAPLLAMAYLQACQGDKAAALVMGESFETGIGVPEDAELASRWYRLAAVKGPPPTTYIVVPGNNASPLPGPLDGRGPAFYPEAAFRLGVMHIEGRGVPQDLKAARHWLRKAMDGGHPLAGRALRAIE
ncbi:sel1 repeat family protein [Aerophototrophica crusticola]|uniref:Sel1 repeat family protein n=1 Tax=Aerophototrophica crusticola TaxID=1709002 RepID=A0A858RBP9_9PROT|nr:sel1 repeat family protein [Rhodospirillaceae bacterium B3]